MLCGWFISPGPEPWVVPHDLMNLPSFENFTTRPLAFATWPSVTKMSPLLRDDDVARAGERLVGFRRDAGLAERHQHFAVRTELEDLAALAVLGLRVGHPDVAVAIDRHAVSLHEHSGSRNF